MPKISTFILALLLLLLSAPAHAQIYTNYTYDSNGHLASVQGNTGYPNSTTTTSSSSYYCGSGSAGLAQCQAMCAGYQGSGASCQIIDTGSYFLAVITIQSTTNTQDFQVFYNLDANENRQSVQVQPGP